MIERIDPDRRGSSRAALGLAALAGALFGGLAVGAAGLGIVSLTATTTSAVSGGVVIGASLILAVCLMWNLDTRAAAQREDRLLAADIGLTRQQVAKARERARRLAAHPDLDAGTSSEP